LNYTRVGRP